MKVRTPGRLLSRSSPVSSFCYWRYLGTGVKIRLMGWCMAMGTEQLGTWSSEWSINLPRLHDLIAGNDVSPS